MTGAINREIKNLLTKQGGAEYFKPMPDLIPQEFIEKKIFLLRDQKVMLDRDLARLYGVTTGNLK